MPAPITIKRNVMIIVEKQELVSLLVNALSEREKVSTGKEHTLYQVLSYLIGCSDVKAVQMANRKADNLQQPRVEVDEFRRWLPGVLSEIFAEFVREREVRREPQ